MPRLLVAVAAGLAILLVIASLTWYLTFGIKITAPAMVDIDGLEKDVSIEFLDSGPVHIEAMLSSDIPTALGFSHGVNRTWETILMRQAALGRLSEWFGSSALPEDRLSRRLSLAGNAELIYENLPAADRDILIRYAEGINAALRLEEIQAIAPLVILEIEPETWEPWHALAVERLWMWLAADSQPDTGSFAINNAPIGANMTDTRRVISLWSESKSGRADRKLRRRLHLFGFQDDLAGAVRNTDDLSLVVRYVTGDTGLPVFQPVSASVGGKLFIEGLSVPGTLFFPAARNSAGSWVSLLRTHLAIRIDTYPQDVDVSYERIRDDRLQESVLESIRTRAGDLVVERVGSNSTRSPFPVVPTDTDSSGALILTWSGFSQESEINEWNRVLNGELPSYSILSGTGILAKAGSREAIITGAAETQIEFNDLTLISNSVFGKAIDLRVRAEKNKLLYSKTPIGLLHDEYSATAESSIQFLLELLLPGSTGDSTQVSQPFVDPAMQEALSYLYAWDYSFDQSSIAATISEALLLHFDQHPRDTISAKSVSSGLRAVLDTLSMRHGSDLRNWRWEATQNRRVFFPGDGYQEEDPSRRVRQFREEFPPVVIAGSGHPTTLSWGPSERYSWRAASTAWNLAFHTDSGGSFEYSLETVSYTRFLGRFMAENRSAQTRHLNPLDRTGYMSRLRPRGR